jgi:tetratricopeptide (TPR) repeat protein
MTIAWVIAAVLFLAAHAWAAAAGGQWWGLHFARYLDPGRILVCVAAGAFVARTIATSGKDFGKDPAALSRWLLPAAAFAAFWLLRDRMHFLGDGSVFSEVRAEWSAWASREPLGHVLAHRIHSVADSTGIDFHRLFELWSCALGAALVAVLAHADRETKSGGYLLALSLTTGAIQLFFGYIEHYPPVALVTVLLLLEMRRILHRPRTLLISFGLFVLALFLHLSSVILIPALGYAVLRQLQLRTTRARALALVETAGVAVAAFFAWEAIFGNISHAPSLAGYLGVLLNTTQYLTGSTHDASSIAPPLFSSRHLMAFVNLQLLLVPIALPLAIAGVIRVGIRELWSRPWEFSLALASAGYFAAQFLFDPYLGAPRDWDTLATGAFPVAFLAARLLPDVLESVRARALLIGLAAAHSLAFVLVNATPSSAIARFEELPLAAGQVDFTMGTRALRAGDLPEAERRFESVVQAAPYSTLGWFSLGMVHERQRNFDKARDAFTRALASRQVDQRVAADQILERLARAAMETGRNDEARRALQLALNENPSSETARILSAVLALREHRPADALQTVEPLLKTSPHPAPWILAADALDSLGRGAEANALRSNVARRFPGGLSTPAP